MYASCPAVNGKIDVVSTGKKGRQRRFPSHGGVKRVAPFFSH